MPLILLLFGLMVPRLVMALLWLFTNWFHGMFSTMVWPLLGFMCLPTTLLWYSVVVNWMGGQFGPVALVGFLITLVIDIGPLNRRRRVVTA